MADVHVIVTSFYQDFQAEREVVEKQVFPEFVHRCERNALIAKFTKVNLGAIEFEKEKYDLLEELTSLKNEADQETLILSINFTSVEIGAVPVNLKDASPNIVSEYENQLNLSPVDVKLMQYCYAPDLVSSVWFVRSDSFWNIILPEESALFLKPNLSETAHQLGKDVLSSFAPERVWHYDYTSASFDWDTNIMDVNLSRDVRLRLHLWLDDTIREQSTAEFRRSRSSARYTGPDKEDESFLLLRFVTCTKSSYFGRETELEKIRTYLQNAQDRAPFILLGGEGYGKSTVMAKAVHHTLTDNLWNGSSSVSDVPEVLFHFANATEYSSSLLVLLQRLLLKLKVAEGLASVPLVLSEAVHLVYKALSSVELDQRVAIFVDGLNRIAESDSPMLCSWIPKQLAPNVKLIVSCTENTFAHKSILSRPNEWKQVYLSPLTKEETVLILNEQLQKTRRTLTEREKTVFLKNKGCQHPMWIKLAAYSLTKYPTEQRFQYISKLPEDLEGLWATTLASAEPQTKSALCLLYVAKYGLTIRELGLMLGGGSKHLKPPSPGFDKGSCEISEKKLLLQGEKKLKSFHSLSSKETMNLTHNLVILLPHLTLVPNLVFLQNQAYKDAVRKTLLCATDEEKKLEDSSRVENFWRRHLIKYLAPDISDTRRAKEYLFQLVKTNNYQKLADTLSTWEITSLLYDEDYSTELIRLWRETRMMDTMVSKYRFLIRRMESAQGCEAAEITRRYAVISRILLQAGFYQEAEELALEALTIEEKQFGKRPEWVVEFFDLLAEIQDEKVKLNDYSHPMQIPQLQKTIEYFRKSIELRKSLKGNYHKSRLAKSMMKLAFSLESWQTCGGDHRLTPAAAHDEAVSKLDYAEKTFLELNEIGHYAEAMMTKGVLMPSGDVTALEYYNSALEICNRIYGEVSFLSSRLQINIGIVHENRRDYVTTFSYFRRWAQYSEIVLGPKHPKTIRAKKVLKEPRYVFLVDKMREVMKKNGGRKPTEAVLSKINEQVHRCSQAQPSPPEGEFEFLPGDLAEELLSSERPSLGLTVQLQNILSSGSRAMPITRIRRLLEDLTLQERLEFMESLLTNGTVPPSFNFSTGRSGPPVSLSLRSRNGESGERNEEEEEDGSDDDNDGESDLDEEDDDTSASEESGCCTPSDYPLSNSCSDDEFSANE